MNTQSSKAMADLLSVLEEASTRWASPEWNINNEADQAGAHRTIMHLLQVGLVSHFETDASAPLMQRMVTPSRKMLGDNPDAVYYDTAVHPDFSYTLSGKTKGAVYVSITLEAGMGGGGMSAATVGVLNSDNFDIDETGRFEVQIGGPKQARNWIAMPQDASRLTTRHYFEEATPAAANLSLIHI